MSESQMVGMSQIRVCGERSGVLIALGLGSCMGICAYDARAGVAGLAHVVLPSSATAPAPFVPSGKFADTAVPLLLEEMAKLGANPQRVVVALVGGAQLFAGAGIGKALDIGPRNAQAVQEEVARHKLRVLASDIGGSSGRTVHLLGNGVVRVKTLGKGEHPLVNLSEPFRAVESGVGC